MTLRRIPPTRQQGIEAARRLKKLLRAKGFPVRAVFLFGSVAKGTTNEWSDIDVAVVHDPFGQNRSEELRSMCQAEIGTDLRNTEVLYFHPEDLDDKYSTIAREVNTNGIPV